MSKFTLQGDHILVDGNDVNAAVLLDDLEKGIV